MFRLHLNVAGITVPNPSRFVDGLFSDCVLRLIACIRLDFGPSLRFIQLLRFPRILELRVNVRKSKSAWLLASHRQG